MSSRQIQISASEQNLIDSVAELIIKEAQKAKDNHGYFSIGFSGGSIVKIVSAGLLNRQAEIDWTTWRVFFCDERYVPLDAADSNSKAVKDGFLSKVPVKPEQIFDLNPALELSAAAADYSSKVQSVHGSEGLPKFDLLLLGMGPDGHTCSLFPGHALLDEKDLIVASISDSPKPPPQRITLTLPVVNNARVAAFIAAGAGKAPMVRRVLEPGAGEDILPAGRVQPSDGQLIWYLDGGSAAELKQPQPNL
ncbi:6-phosphogluconolactonase-like [Sycon ciliatum]|uniref:6-phosphogluconolactonase-like n=1 Tax=Sycon ciliatum TaxID=27933 RepID=UPI0020AC7185|eukprot:scpid74242/ scgid13548/ 6-phosphogluconolactonase